MDHPCFMTGCGTPACKFFRAWRGPKVKFVALCVEHQVIIHGDDFLDRQYPGRFVFKTVTEDEFILGTILET